MSEGLVMVCDVDLAVPDATRTHTVEVARGFVAEGFDVDLVARGPDPRLSGVRYARAQATEHQRLARIGSLNALVFGLLWRRHKTVRRLYVRHRWTLMPVLLAGRLLRYRIVTQVDDIPYGRGYEQPIPELVDQLQRFATVVMAWLAHGIVAITPQIKGLLVDQFRASPEKIAVLPNGVDVDFFRPLTREDAIRRAELDPRLRYITFSGRFAAWVDFETLLSGFSIVLRQRDDVRLLLVGDGEEREWIERRVRELGIEHAVIVTGFVQERSRVRDYLGATTVAVASHQSGYVGRIGVSPTKLAEYLAAGRAIVTKDVPGMTEVVRDNDAGIVVPNDPQAMGAAILTLLDPETADRLGANGRRAAERQYAWRSIVRDTIPLFGIGQPVPAAYRAEASSPPRT